MNSHVLAAYDRIDYLMGINDYGRVAEMIAEIIQYCKVQGIDFRSESVLAETLADIDSNIKDPVYDAYDFSI